MEVRIRKMRIVNFKGIRHIEVDFGDTTVISGRNATGKTTVMDAFTWCMFGKDSKGRSAFNVKTLGSDGNAISKLEHYVELELHVSGLEERTFTMKRLLEEEWSKPRGKAELELKGNVTHYFVNGCEVKASEYATTVGGIISEDLFRLIASPKHFASLDWKTQRQILVSMAGDVTYENVADNEDLMEIVRQLSGQDLASYKTGVAYKKKTIKAELESCQPKIAAIQSVTPERRDYASTEKSRKAAADEIAYIDSQLCDINAADKLKLEETTAKQKEINRLKIEQIGIVHNAEMAEKQRINSMNAEYTETSATYETAKRLLESERKSLEAVEKTFDSDIRYEESLLEKYEEEVRSLRDKWHETNSSTYDAGTSEVVCPLTKLICLDSNLKARKEESRTNAIKAFYEDRNRQLDEITAQGKRKNEAIGKCKDEIERLETNKAAEMSKHHQKIESLENKMETYSRFLNGFKLEQPRQIIPSELKEWAEIQNKIEALENEMPEANSQGTDTSPLNERKKALYGEISGYDTILAEKQTIERNENEIRRIGERERELSQQLADIERLEYNAELLEKKRMNEVESRVNGMFSFVRFRMFDKLINGGETPTCVAMVDGVPYQDLNDAMKINAGIDIINTLCRYNKVSAPIFIDNAESVNEFIHAESQTIMLKVSEEECLTISTK